MQGSMSVKFYNQSQVACHTHEPPKCRIYLRGLCSFGVLCIIDWYLVIDFLGSVVPKRR